MNINRHNYETFFLLYVDNELSAAERIAVEKFVEVNTDLKKELALFIETTLPAEAISFAAKSSLLKNEITGALQDDLLLHLDNELPAESKTTIEKRITTDPVIHTEWTILQQTKLDPAEKIVFAHKQLLYRREKDNVVTMRFWKLAIAALFIGAGTFFGIRILKNEKQADTTASNNGIKRSSRNDGVKTQPVLANTDQSIKAPVVNPNTSTDINHDNSVTQNNLVKEGSTQKTIVPVKKQIQLPKKDITTPDQLVKKENIQKESNNLPKPYFENINRNKSNQITAYTVEYKKKETVDKNGSNNLATVTPATRPKLTLQAPENNTVTEMPDNFAKNAVYNELEEKNNDRVLYMNEDKVNKSKFSGFFRKVKRIVVRNTKIKTGDGLRIGGFEIASK